MRICFVAHKCLPIHSRSLEEQPVGGVETGLIRVADALSRFGHSVKVFTPHESPPPSDPPYLPMPAFEREGQTDVIISVRDWLPLFVGVRAKKRFFWTGDSYDQIQNYGIGDHRIIAGIDALFAVSAWHAASLAGRSGFPVEKTWVIRNGVHLPYFAGEEVRARKRLIYSSTPYRGLALVPPLFRALRQRHPDAELHVFSGFDVYGGIAGRPEAERWAATKAVLEKLDGCVLHGNVTQRQLAREYMRSSLLFYPNIFEETSCITAMEAQAAGCAIVTSDRAALRETVGPAGVLIGGRPGTAEYNAAFLEAADRVLSDDSFFERLSGEGRRRAAEIFDWEVIAKRLEEYLRKVHGLE